MAAKANIVVDQGTDFTNVINVSGDEDEAVDLSGYTAAAQIRKHYTSETAVAFDVTFEEPRSSGLVRISLSREVTETIEPGRYVYDVELTSSEDVRTRLVEGVLTVTPQVTRT